MTNREVSRWSVGRRLVAVAAGVMMMSTSCSFFGDDDAATPSGGPGAGPLGAASAGIGTGSQLRVLLSQGQAQAGPAEALAVVDGTVLSDAEVAAILARLPDADIEPGDQVEFNRPAESLRPPLVGDTIDTAFPPPVSEPAERPATAADPLEVLRAQPDGEVGIAPFLAVTFNQAMVPLATVDELTEVDIPVEISPAIEGRWRWIGARTLRFELEPGPIDRLPASTEYEVTIPAGTTAVSGAELAEPYTFRFATPAPRVASLTGVGDPMVLEPVLVAVFDQRVDPEAVLATVTLEAGGAAQDLQLATAEEIEADEAAARAVAAAKADGQDSRWVAFRPTAPLPAASPVTVAVGPGTPSAEGPRTTTEAAEFTGRTFDAFTFSKLTCNYGGDCIPGAPLFLEFNNPIDTTTFDPSMVTVEPALPGLRVAPSGNQLIVTGATRGRTGYTVTVSGQLTDTFGQRLGTDASREIEVGPARPSLAAFQRQFLITDPMADRPGISVTTVNHDSVRVTAWQVSPGDRAAFQRYLEQFYSDTEPGDPSWPQVYDGEIDIDATDDAAVETLVDLSDAFAATDNNQLVVRISPTRTFDVNSEDWWANRPQVAWVQATTLGLDAIIDRGEALIWTTDLVTGAVRPGVTVELLGTGRTVTTDDDGLARVPLNQNSTDPNGQSLVATDGGDVTLVQGYWGGYQGDESRWYVFDDRGIYRPGETVRITGWARQLTTSGDAQLRLYDGFTEVTWRAYDPMGNELGTGTAPVNPLGGFNLSLPLPEGANLGQAFVELTAPVRGIPGDMLYWSHQFQIQDFRTPEFEVTARPESPAPYYTVEPATVAVDAAYFAGGPLPDAEVNWTVTTARTTYRPPSWDRFTFGIWQPWWFTGDSAVSDGIRFGFEGAFGGGFRGFDEEIGFGFPPGGEAEVETLAGRTDAGGSHYLRLDFDGPTVDLPTTVRAEAAVTDVNRQVWASRTDLLVHPARYYVGLRTDRPFVEQGTPLRIDTVVTDVDGVAAADRTVAVTAGRLEWVWSNGTWTEELADTQDCTVTSEAIAPGAEAPESMRCEFTTDLGGQYRITAVVTDDEGHANRSELTMWVSGGDGRPSRTVQQESVTIVPDAETYAPGDTARLLVQAPFSPASGLVTVQRGGIVSSFAFAADNGSAVVEIPVEEAWIPNVTVQVDMVGTAPRLADDGTPADGVPPRPAFATGQLNLPIPPVTRALDVVAVPANDTLDPGDDTAVTVTVTGPDGAPVAGADVALVVVDEAVLSLTGYQLIDPLAVFYGDIWSNLWTEHARASIVLNRADLVTAEGMFTSGGGPAEADEETMETEGAAAFTETTMASADMAANDSAARSSLAAAPVPAAAGPEGDDGSGAPIVVRSDFDPVAVFAPAESTGPDGTVTVAVPLPDNLTRYRVMAVAVDGADRFGKGESTITARLPLMVRPSAPRFLNFGDAFELPVVVQNQTDAAVEVDVAVDAANLTLTAGAGKRVSVPANDRVEVRFPAAADRAGTARFRVVGVTTAPAGGAVGDGAADAAAIELPVYTPATAEAFATYGVLDDGAVAQPVDAPDGVFPQFGGLEINTSSTALQALTDAVLYLYDYRYDSAEAYASRIMAVAALRDVLDAFDAEGLPAPAVLNTQVQRDIDRLAALQNDDGGFSHWQRGQRSVPWTSIQATHALVLARDAGFNVPGDTLERALARLADVEALFTGDELYGEQVRNTLSAYALHVRHLGGAGDPSKALALWERAGDDLELDALAWLWTALDEAGGGAGATAGAAIERTITNRATDTAGAVTFTTSYGDDAWVIAHSDRRTDGIVLDALISQRPDSDLIPKAVAGLLGKQRRGRWDNVLENGFILVAMKRYFDTFESVTPDFVARAWLGDTYAAEHRFEGRTTDRSAALVPMAEVVAAGDTRVVVAKDGPGRLYYRLGLRYAPDDLSLAPRDKGFVVERRYVAVDDPGDVTRDADGTWRIRAGATVQVELTMVADAARTHVALIDPLPAGLEPLNPALAASPTPPPAPPADGDDDGLWPLGDIGWCWCWQWYQHQNLRDDRAEAFTSYLPGGTYTYTYTARATTPGTFVVPPTRAEEMYAPETFGRSASATVVVN